MFFEACIIGLLIGFIRKGNVRNFSSLRIRGWYFAILAVILQLPIYKSELVPFAKDYILYIFIASSLLIFITLLLNIDKKGTWLILLGAILNIGVLFLNDMKMPIYMNGLELAGMVDIAEKITSGGITRFIPLENITDFTKFLGKYIVLPKPYPLAKVLSIGDVLMSIGLIVFIQGEMIRTKYKAKKTRMVILGYNSKI